MPTAASTTNGITSVSTSAAPVLRTLQAPKGGSRRQTPQAKQTAAARYKHFLVQLENQAAALRQMAQKYREAGNLEQTLAMYLELCLTLENLRDAPGASNTKTKKAATCSELRSVYMVLQQLHQQVQAKKTYYHGCMDTDSDEEDAVVVAQDSRTPPSHGSATGSMVRRRNGTEPLPRRRHHPRRRLDCTHVNPISLSDRSTTPLSSIVGNHHIKQDILNGIVKPFQQPLLFQVRRSFLFYGPPGTGKTMFARAAAHSLGNVTTKLHVLFFAPTTDMLKDKYVGGSEHKITTYFRCVQQQAEDAEQSSGTPTLGIIFLDELDSLARSRDVEDASGSTSSTTNTLLQMMDGFSSLPNVIVMAATNYPWQLDAAIQSRFQEKIYVRLPDVTTIQALLRHNLMAFYKQTLGIDASTDPLAEQHTGTDPDTSRWEILSHVLQVSDDQLLLVARRLCQPTPYSPSNIRDVCARAFRVCARLAHRAGIFHEVRVATTSDAFRRCTKAEQALLHHMHKKYASATTFARLRESYRDVIADTQPHDIRTHRTLRERQQQGVFVAPGRVHVRGKAYVQAEWQKRQRRGAPSPADAAIDTLIALFQSHPHAHLYLPEKASAVHTTTDTTDTTTTTNDTEKSGLAVVVVRQYTVQYGPHDNHTLQVCARTELKSATVQALEAYANSRIRNLRAHVEGLLGLTTPLQWVISHMEEVYCRDLTLPDAEWWAVSYPSSRKEARAGGAVALSRQRLVDETLYHSPEQPLELHTFPWSTNKALFRFVCWLGGCDPAKPLPKEAAAAGLVTLRSAGTTSAVQFEDAASRSPRHTTERDQRAIEQKLFSLDVNLDEMLDAVDGERNEDAIIPSVSARDIRRLDEYWKSGKA